MTISSLPHRAQFELEKDLEPILHEIEGEKEKLFAKRNVIYLTAKEFFHSAKEEPWMTVGKLAFGTFAVAALHPLVLGSIACLNAYRVQNVNDLYSSNLTVANNASQLFSNLGHSVGYLVEGAELLAITSGLLFWKSYRRVSYHIIDEVYNKHIQNPRLSKEESDFLYARKREELSLSGLLAINDKKRSKILLSDGENAEVKSPNNERPQEPIGLEAV